jgi:Golgi apparatus protein 1
VDSLCADAKGDGHGKAAVLKCLAASLPSMSNKACQAEVGRALRMALWQYRPHAALTDVCDADVEAHCPAEGANVAVGSVGRCLARLLANSTAAGVASGVSEACGKLVAFAVPRDPKAMFDSDLNSAALATKLAELQAAAASGLASTLVRTDTSTGSSAITLTGWVALLAVGSLVIVVVGAAVFAYRKYMGLDRPYTLVVKGGDV